MRSYVNHSTVGDFHPLYASGAIKYQRHHAQSLPTLSNAIFVTAPRFTQTGPAKMRAGPVYDQMLFNRSLALSKPNRGYLPRTDLPRHTGYRRHMDLLLRMDCLMLVHTATLHMEKLRTD